MELMLVLGVISVALMMFASTVSGASRQRAINRENSLAADAAQRMLETMQNRAFREVFLLYNSDAADDPGGAGTAPGHRFDVEGLDPAPDSPDGMIGEVSFPAVNVAAPGDPIDLELREDVLNEIMGTPRDLDGDSIIDADDHSADYFILPVQIRLRWSGKSGTRELTVFATLTEFNWS